MKKTLSMLLLLIAISTSYKLQADEDEKPFP